MVSTFIVTIEDFKNRASISNNILTSRFKQESSVIQEQYATQVLCNDLYNNVLSQIESGSYTEEVENLMPYIKDFLVHKIEASYMVDSNYIPTPSGFRTKDDETSTIATERAMAKMIQKQEGRADFYQDRLVNFLKSNKDQYPEWKDSICGRKDIKANVTNSFTKIGSKRRSTKIKWT